MAGEQRVVFTGGDINTSCRLVTLPPFWDLAAARCRFIVNNQQYKNPGSYLDGAYLIYDNEEHHLVCNHVNDHNAGRERIGMALLLARYLQARPDAAIEQSLAKYLVFALRELVDAESGEVYNDAPRCNDYTRLYNDPWFARLFLECYRLWGDKAWLDKACRVLANHYAKGGDKHYSIGIPVVDSIGLLREAGMEAEAQALMGCFLRHAGHLLKNGMNYPAHEVNYEQSIVAPAAIFLLEMYQLTNDAQYLAGGEHQLEILGLFNGDQPDGYLHQTAIRHWDGFWFGKRKLYGDTFPHYWSALTGIAYSLYHEITGNEQYLSWAQNSLRGVLPLVFPDGSGSCARLHPLTVNGQRGNYFDPWANDQDWGLYFMLKYGKIPEEANS